MGFKNIVTPSAKECTGGKLIATRYERSDDQPRFRARIPKIVQKKHAAMRQQITMDQSADVAVLADENAPLFVSLGQQDGVSRVRFPLRYIDHIMTGLAQRPDGRGDDVRVSQDAHLLGRDDKTFFSRKLAQPRGI